MRRLPYQPAEGWLAVVLVAIMSVTIAWSLDDPGWVQGNHAWTDFLPIAALLGAAAGFLGAKSGWPRWAAHLTGAFFAALILPVLTGWSQQPGASPPAAFGAVSDAAVNAWIDLAITRLAVTSQTLHTLLAFGVLVWAAGQVMAYSVFGHRRPLDAVVVGGLVLIVNMAATGNDQVRFLVIYSAASLFLLVTMHALDERTTWIRRRIGDPAPSRSSTSAAGPCSSWSRSWARCCSWIVPRPLRCAARGPASTAGSSMSATISRRSCPRAVISDPGRCRSATSHG